jgi:hypothetical protein
LQEAEKEMLKERERHAKWEEEHKRKKKPMTRKMSEISLRAGSQVASVMTRVEEEEPAVLSSVRVDEGGSSVRSTGPGA